MKKKWIRMIILGLISSYLLWLIPAQAIAPPIKLLVTNKEIKFNYGEPKIIDGRTYVPIRDVAEWFGKSIHWSQDAKTIWIDKFLVKIIDKNFSEIGTASLSQTIDGVSISLELKGLSPGKHGIHIHSQSFTGTDFQSAGAHFNPELKKHGQLNPDGSHSGDLGNLVVREDGTVKTTIVAKGLSLDATKQNSILSRSIIIHDKEDDDKTDPTGQSGERIAGGNIPN